GSGSSSHDSSMVCAPSSRFSPARLPGLSATVAPWSFEPGRDFGRGRVASAIGFILIVGSGVGLDDSGISIAGRGGRERGSGGRGGREGGGDRDTGSPGRRGGREPDCEGGGGGGSASARSRSSTLGGGVCGSVLAGIAGT